MIKMKSETKINIDWKKIGPLPHSAKGENGKVLVIGGSRLFHAPLKWTLCVLSRIVDMVFCASTEENNKLLNEAKGGFWEGIVISHQEVEDYLTEADIILIGPGMERQKETGLIANRLVEKYPKKKWVIDAGALQMLNPELINSNCIITPNVKEWTGLQQKRRDQKIENLKGGCLLKGEKDRIFWEEELIAEITGGNAGMIKGGTGDCLAALVAGLAINLDSVTAMVMASQICKESGDQLYKEVGPFFNASDLAQKIPKVLSEKLKKESL